MRLHRWLRASLNLVVLSKLIYCSSSALTLYTRMFDPASLFFQIYFRMIAISQVIASEKSSSQSPNSSLRSLAGSRYGTCCCKQLNRRLPTPSFLLQWSSSCCMVPSSVQSCILHSALLAAPILCSLAYVLMRLCSINQRKLASSGDTPGCLQFDQDSSQSVVGERTSALHGTKFLSSSSGRDIMVT